jgi:cephalosporin-C deacetylase-like acetyl esterase
MQFMRAALLIFAVTLSAQDAAMLRHFDYDRNAPLDIKQNSIETRASVDILDITYASPAGGRVPAYLVLPHGKGPFAAVIWGHWYMQGSEFRNRKEFLAEAEALAAAGVVSLLIDYPIARAGHIEDTAPLNLQQITDRVQSILDSRRGADLLLERPDVDPARLAYVGHSYNASTGAFLSGIDRRFKAFVLMAGTLSDQVSMKIKEVQESRQQVGPEKFDAFMQEYSWLDQGRYVSHAVPAPVFMQYAAQETFLTPEIARQYAEIVSEPKRFKLYDAPHALNAEARRDRIAFLTEQLKLKPLPQKAIKAVPDLVQPAEK